MNARNSGCSTTVKPDVMRTTVIVRLQAVKAVELVRR
jgi:hypothetical protein